MADESTRGTRGMSGRVSRVLFNWQPRTFDGFIADRFRRRLMKCGWYTLPSLVQFRSPVITAATLPEAKEWHHDDAARPLLEVGAQQ